MKLSLKMEFQEYSECSFCYFFYIRDFILYFYYFSFGYFGVFYFYMNFYMNIVGFFYFNVYSNLEYDMFKKINILVVFLKRVIKGVLRMRDYNYLVNYIYLFINVRGGSMVV